MRYFCSKDCYDFCEFNMETNPAGKVVFDPVAKPWEKTGFVCSKLKGFYQRETEQAATPFIVENGEKQHCSDTEALDFAAALLHQHKDGRILALRGSGSLGLMMKYWETLLTQLPGMEIIESGICDTTGDQAHLDDFGILKNPPLKNLDHVDTILLFGKNARVTSPHLYAHLIQLKKQGKRIIYIDPVYSETAPLADHYIHIKPGSDGCLAALLLARLGKEEQSGTKELQEVCAISDTNLAMLQKSLIEGKTAFICGYGMQRYHNGKNSFQWVNRLAVATGNIDYLYMGHSSTKDLIKPPRQERPELSLAQAVEAMEQGSVDLLVVIAANPAVSFPDSNRWAKLLEQQKCIVIDVCNTPTTEKADCLLAVGGMFAQPDVQGSFFFEGHALRPQPFLQNCLSDCDVISELAQRLDLSLKITPPQKVEEKPLPGERIYCHPDLPLLLPSKPRSGLRLLTTSSSDWLNSQVPPQAPKRDTVAHISAATAQNHGLQDGDRVQIIGVCGSFETFCTISERVDDCTVLVYKSREMLKGWPNMAVPLHETDADNGIAIYEATVTLQSV